MVVPRNDAIFPKLHTSRYQLLQILCKIMGAEYRESSARVVSWDDTALEMQQQNVCPLDGLFWGEPQVVRQKLEVHGHSHPC